MHSLFKPIVAVLCLIFTLCFAAPNAHADTLYEYTVTTTNPLVAPFAGFSFTTVPIPLTDLNTILPISDLSASSLTGSAFAGSTLTGVILDQFLVGETGVFATSFSAVFRDGFSATDYSTPGTHIGGFNTMVVTVIQMTPEPSSLSLMLAGIGLVFAMRKRSSGPQHAS